MWKKTKQIRGLSAVSFATCTILNLQVEKESEKWIPGYCFQIVINHDGITENTGRQKSKMTEWIYIDFLYYRVAFLQFFCSTPI